MLANVRPQLTHATGHFTFDPGYGVRGISPAASRIAVASSCAYFVGITRTITVKQTSSIDSVRASVPAEIAGAMLE
jgi:hypothetical protein